MNNVKRKQQGLPYRYDDPALLGDQHIYQDKMTEYNRTLPTETELRQKLLREVFAEAGTDCVSRSFCPKLSIAEDPVCGSAHCQIAASWAEQLNKKEIYAYQASKRGGYLHCRIEKNKRITISGEAALVAVSEIVAEL